MKPSELHPVFLDELRLLLPEWQFVSSARHFKRVVGSVNWLFHIAWVNHSEDFDAIGDVAIEFLAARKRVAIFGAQLGNIAGVGQTRHAVSSFASAKASARALFQEFEQVGLPFLEQYSSPETVLSVLESGGQTARLISPIQDLHVGQIQTLRAMSSRPNNSFKPNPHQGVA
jgi:hypothetical protein